MSVVIEPMRLRAILLDFDGLICDTERAALRSWQELYARYRLQFPRKLWLEMVGRADGERRAAADLAHRLGRPVEERVLIARRRRKQELAQVEPLRPGVARLLAEVGKKGVIAAVVSSSTRSWVECHLTRLGMNGAFRAIVTGDDVEEPKPSPHGYQLALQRLEIPAAAVVALEDSLPGLRAARAAGLRCVAIPSPAGAPIMATDADLLLPSLVGVTLDMLTGSEKGVRL